MLKLLTIAFQIFFYPGSYVKHSNYQPLLHQIQRNLHQNVSLVDRSLCRPNIITNDSVLIGHSFGGYFALRDMMKHPEHVKGAVLLNSHFNSRHKAFYPGISQSEVGKVLVILGDKDKRLPLGVAIDDLFEKIQKRLYDKHYIINQGFDHFSGITGNSTHETLLLADQISEFVRGIEQKDFSETVLRSNDSLYDPHISGIVPSAMIMSRSLGLMDALWSFVLPPKIWESLHWWLFLLAKPDDYFNYLFETDEYIYLKTRNISSKILERYLQSLGASVRHIRLPSVHAAVIAWLFLPLIISKDATTGEIICPLLEYPINNITTYFRFPHPHRIFQKMI